MNLEQLKQKEGEIVEYFYRGKYRQYKLVAVQLDEHKIIKNDISYHAEVGKFRLDYIDDKIREWGGFWTDKISNIK